MYTYGTRKNLSFSLEKYTIVVQTEVMPSRHAVENIDRGYRNRNIYILLVS
jgi:hypothetical protein